MTFICQGVNPVVSQAATEKEANREAATAGREEKMGRKSDAILRTITNGRRLEIGATEAGRVFEGEFAIKWELEANLKLPKALRTCSGHYLTRQTGHVSTFPVNRM
jgi:hypothetical protein